MPKNIYLNFLILFEILFQGIMETSTEKSIMESSNLPMRNKRQVLSRFPHAIMRMTIQQIPYVVQIQEAESYICTGSVLSNEMILTAAHCVDERRRYHVLSGSEHIHQGNLHAIRRIILHPDYNPIQYANDLALLRINPGIDIHRSPIRPIKLNNRFVPPETDGLVSSWGCIGTERNVEIYPNQLRSIATCVISNQACQRNIRQHHLNVPAITDRDICTLDTVEESRCGDGDSGAPLVISNELVGVMAWNGNHIGPDIFMNLSHPVYRRWLLENIPSLPGY